MFSLNQEVTFGGVGVFFNGIANAPDGVLLTQGGAFLQTQSGDYLAFN